MRGTDYVVKFLEENGIRHSFGIPGGHALNIFDSLKDMKEIKHILTKHEQGATFMATGYNMASGKLAVAIGTAGPGAANLASGLTVAYTNSIPVLALTAQAPIASFGRGFVQEGSGWGPRTLSHEEMFRGYTKWSVMVPTVEKLPLVLPRAFRTMLSGRMGPVHLDLPIEVQAGEINKPLPLLGRHMPYVRVRADLEAMKKAVALLMNAETPVILAGGGILRSNATSELFELANFLNIPVATTFNGKGTFPEDHPLCLGIVGSFGHDVANTLIRKNRTDVLLAIGCAFSTVTTNNYIPEFGGEKIIQIDIDPAEIGKNYPVEVGMVGDAKLFLQDLKELTRTILNKDKELGKKVEERGTKQLKEILRLKEETKYYKEDVEFSKAVPIKPQRAVREISEAINKTAIVFVDSGNHAYFTERYLPCYTTSSFVVDGWHTHMGWTIGGSIGAKLARPDKQVIDIIGDASFMMHCKEVATAKHYNIPVVFCILNDNALGAIRHYQKLMFHERYFAAVGTNPDFVKFAESFGVFGIMVKKPEEIKPALKAALESGKPAIVDIRIDPEEIHPGVPIRMQAINPAL